MTTPTMTLLAALDELAAAGTAAGLPTVVGAADLQIPGAALYLNTVTWAALDAGTGHYDFTADLLLVAGAGGDRSALDQLDRMLALAADVYGISSARAVSVTLPSFGESLPALQATISAHVTPDD